MTRLSIWWWNERRWERFALRGNYWIFQEIWRTSKRGNERGRILWATNVVLSIKPTQLGGRMDRRIGGCDKSCFVFQSRRGVRPVHKFFDQSVCKQSKPRFENKTYLGVWGEWMNLLALLLLLLFDSPLLCMIGHLDLISAARVRHAQLRKLDRNNFKSASDPNPNNTIWKFQEYYHWTSSILQTVHIYKS